MDREQQTNQQPETTATDAAADGRGERQDGANESGDGGQPPEIDGLEAKTRDIERREKELLQKTLDWRAKEILRERGLASELSEFLIGSDLEATEANIALFEPTFRQAVQDAVNDRLKTSTPGAGYRGSCSSATREQTQKAISGIMRRNF